MLGSILLFCFTVVGVILSVVLHLELKIFKVKVSLYWLVAMLGAALSVCFGFVSFDDLRTAFFTNSSVNPLKILVLFISMTAISIFLDEAGFYSFLAAKGVKYAGKSQKKLFLLLYLLASVLTVFTSNDIIILTFTPFILYFCRRCDINPIPYIFAEFVAANTWSMFFLFGNPTNIYLSTAFAVAFGDYFLHMWLATVLAGVTSFALLYLVFHKALSTPMQECSMPVPPIDKSISAIGLTFLGVCIVALAIASYVGLEMWYLSLACGGGCLLCGTAFLLIKKRDLHVIKQTVKKLPWALVPFLLSMFILIVCLKNTGMVGTISNILPENDFVWGAVSAFSANVLNNIPMSVLFAAMLENCSGVGCMYAVVVGSNLGAILTPIGALAGIMWLNIIKTHNVKFGFLSFVKYGAIICLPTLAAALFGVWVLA